MSTAATSSSTFYAAERQRTFITQVYLWMSTALAVTALVALVVSRSETILSMIMASQGVFIGLLIVELLMVMGLTALIGRMSSSTATLVFLFYAALNGVTFAVILLAFTAVSVATTFFVTAGTFGLMSIVGYTTKRDLSGIGGLLSMALIGLIIATVVNMFLASTMLDWLVTYAGIAIFVGLTAYDTQKLKAMSEAGLDSEAGRKASVLGALALYLDFVNLFLMLLRIFGRRR
jgi:uncharacterized protein